MPVESVLLAAGFQPGPDGSYHNPDVGSIAKVAPNGSQIEIAGKVISPDTFRQWFGRQSRVGDPLGDASRQALDLGSNADRV